MERLPKDGLPIYSDDSEHMYNIYNGERQFDSDNARNNQSQQNKSDTQSVYSREYIMNTLHTVLGILKDNPTGSNIDGDQFDPAADGYLNEICDDLMGVMDNGRLVFTPPPPNPNTKPPATPNASFKIPSEPPPPPNARINTPTTPLPPPFGPPPQSTYGFGTLTAPTHPVYGVYNPHVPPSPLPDNTFYIPPSPMPVRVPCSYNPPVPPSPPVSNFCYPSVPPQTLPNSVFYNQIPQQQFPPDFGFYYSFVQPPVPPDSFIYTPPVQARAALFPCSFTPPETPQPQPSPPPPPPQEPQPPVSNDSNPSAAPSHSSRRRHNRHTHVKG